MEKNYKGLPKRSLTFKEFIDTSGKFNIKDIPAYNNFFLQFLVAGSEGRDWANLRKDPIFKRFQAEHAELEQKLSEGIVKADKNSNDRSEAIRPFHGDLYKAYVIMRGYKVSNEDLFS